MRCLDQRQLSMEAVGYELQRNSKELPWSIPWWIFWQCKLQKLLFCRDCLFPAWNQQGIVSISAHPPSSIGLEWQKKWDQRKMFFQNFCIALSFVHLRSGEILSVCSVLVHTLDSKQIPRHFGIFKIISSKFIIWFPSFLRIKNLEVWSSAAVI